MEQERRREVMDGPMTEGVIWKQLLMFFFPILLGTFFQQLYNTVDAMIVGKAVGKEALAAVGGATGNIVNLLVGFFVGLSSGATVIISQYYGARKDMDVSRAVHTAFAMSLVFGLMLSVVGYFLSPALLRLMQTPDSVMPHAVSYIRIYFMGMIPTMIYNMGSGVLRAVGDSRRPLYFLMASAITNIILDVILVIGCELGVAGAAAATVASQLVSAVLVILTLMRTARSFRLFPKRIRLHGDMLHKIVAIGFPAGLQSVMYSVSNVLIQSAVNHFDTDVLAGWTAYGKLDGMFWMIINAFGVAITTFSGQNFGARRYDRMRRGTLICLLQTAIASLSVSALLLLFGRSFYSLFTADAAVVEQGMIILHQLVPFYVTYVCVEVLSGAVRGSGDSLVPTLMTLFGICLVRVVWILGVVPSHNTLQTVLISYPLTWILTSTLFLAYYFQGGWLKRQKRRIHGD